MTYDIAEPYGPLITGGAVSPANQIDPGWIEVARARS